MSDIGRLACRQFVSASRLPEAQMIRKRQGERERERERERDRERARESNKK